MEILGRYFKVLIWTASHNNMDSPLGQEYEYEWNN